MHTKIPCLIISLLLTVSAFADTTIEGTVVSVSQAPIPGATVLVVAGDSTVAGTSTDDDGRFRLIAEIDMNAQLRVSAVGFERRELSWPRSDRAKLRVELREIVTEVSGISVTPGADDFTAQRTLGGGEIRDRARRSLVPTNPVAAIRQPAISRPGSGHSSQIRVHGTAPEYYLNGLPLGVDPDHFGVFSLIPATVLDRTTFVAHGTDASLGTPSVVSLHTQSDFVTGFSGSVQMSAIEGTVMARYGSGRTMVIGAIRKSVIDKLLQQFDPQGDRAIVPPSNFQDIFLSSGFVVSPTVRLFIDQYHTRDFLSFNTAEVNTSNDVDLYQKTDEHFVGARMQVQTEDWLLESRLAVHDRDENYATLPEPDDMVRLSLESAQQDYTAAVDLAREFGRYGLRVGADVRYTGNRRVQLQHQNWNFVPPFSNTDNPFVYQTALNELYGSYEVSDRETNSASYVTVRRDAGDWSLESGLRLEQYSALAGSKKLLWRHRLRWQVHEGGSLEFFHGSFGENPARKIMEPYQVLTRDWLAQLRPITTQLWSAGYVRGAVSLRAFYKTMSDLPVTSVDFGAVDANGDVLPGFIQMRSSGRAQFAGVSAEIDLKSFLSQKLDVYASYAYSHSKKRENGVVMPHDLDAPHRFMLDGEYRLSGRLAFSGTLQVRTGYPYSPVMSPRAISTDPALASDQYTELLHETNSRRFPMYASLDLGARYKFGRGVVFVSIANVTDRANPIVNAQSGYIYDTGILPSIGVEINW